MFTASQRYVRKMVLLGFLTSAVVIVISWFVSPEFHFHTINGQSIRIKVFMLTLLIAIIPMLFFIFRITSQRISGKAILGDSSDPVVEIDVRVLNNTHEQFLLFGVVSLVLSFDLPEMRLAMPVIMAVAFNIYRFLYWKGYHTHPIIRTYGFATTFCSNVFLFIFSIFLIIGLI